MSIPYLGIQPINDMLALQSPSLHIQPHQSIFYLCHFSFIQLINRALKEFHFQIRILFELTIISKQNTKFQRNNQRNIRAVDSMKISKNRRTTLSFGCYNDFRLSDC